MTIGSSLLLIAAGAIGLAIGLYLLFRRRWSAGARPGPN